MKKIAIIGGGISGLTAAYRLHRLGMACTLFEAGPRLGGIVETHRENGFVIECGPDSWVAEKPWARELAIELGLGGEIIPSNDHNRLTYVLQQGALVPMPAHMRMMVPQGQAGMDSLLASSLFSEEAKRAYLQEPSRARELKDYAAAHAGEDESIAAFVARHFGQEVAEKLAAPLLSGVFGGSIHKLSVHAVMAPFVALEREHGSLIAGLASRQRTGASLFASLRSGLGGLIERMAEALPPSSLRLREGVVTLTRMDSEWKVETAQGRGFFDTVLLATPPQQTSALLAPLLPGAAELLPRDASSAIIIALAFREHFPLPPGFGFLVPEGSSESRLLAATFVDQKFAHRAPEGGRVLRAFFADEDLMDLPDSVLIRLGMNELSSILGQTLPEPAISLVRRWPASLPQYEVGHRERVSALEEQVASLSGLRLLGNAYHGVGLPDLVRQANEAAQRAASL
ncbi:protoporphyrinogen oxidase [Terriglobus albidus]|uniref:protoporphyrinogen oxidase n=1 Tax=Terriglobus albidus TaxID=1592106 RepID=UPI0021E0415A|nr:protoporphyrinogen oxidase [Terriglobus albidus]